MEYNRFGQLIRSQGLDEITARRIPGAFDLEAVLEKARKNTAYAYIIKPDWDGKPFFYLDAGEETVGKRIRFWQDTRAGRRFRGTATILEVEEGASLGKLATYGAC